MPRIRRFLQCIFVWGVPQAKGDLHEAQVILTQAMCNLSDGSASKTNMLLAKCVRKNYIVLGAPVFPQGELAQAIERQQVPIIGQTRILQSSGVFEEGYFDTYSVALEHKKFCDQMGWKRVVLVSFVPHIWRAKWVYEKLGFEVIIPGEMPKMVFQKDLAQRHWRRDLTGYAYEFLARLYYLWKGYI